MTGRSLPAEVRSAFDTILAATRDVIASAERGDPEALSFAVERRAAAVLALEDLLRSVRGGFDSQQRSELADEADKVARQAEEAALCLRDCVDGLRGGLSSLDREARAARAYGRSAAPRSSFDRSG